MDWLQSKYVGLISVRLRNFKARGNSWNFSCPLCGDSASNKAKARGYIYPYKGNLKFHCHNCSADMTIGQFMQEIDPGLYNEYNLERIKERSQGSAQLKFQDEVVPKKFDSSPLKTLKTLDRLPRLHACRLLVEDRMIDKKYLSKWCYAPSFMSWVNEIIPNKFEERALFHDEARLVIPFYDKHGHVHAFQGRTIVDSDARLRYITIVTDENVPTTFGLDTVNLNKRTYVFEGPIDSTFIPNSIATAGGDFHTRLAGMDQKNLVLVYDNEPRSKDTKKKLIKALKAGFSVCIWPDSMEHKDINNMILAGLNPEYIQYVIDNNIHTGMLSGEIAVKQWSKC
jgi:hypothetical protein